MIKFNRVFKIYEKNIKALEDITFEVKKGEFLFLTGPSGAGKTTILNLLYREDVPTMGTIIVDDTDITHLPYRKIPYYRRNIGFVFQDFKLLFDRSVRENIMLPLIITKANKEYIKKTVDAMLEKFNLKDKENLNPWHLSGGEKQKVAIARALILSPPIILADEPTGNLDEESAWEIMDILLETNNKETTVIVATHNKEIINKLKKRVIKLNKGKIEYDKVD